MTQAIWLMYRTLEHDVITAGEGLSAQGAKVHTWMPRYKEPDFPKRSALRSLVQACLGSPFHCMSYLLPSKCGYREEKGDDV
ncbi:hypothetical protein Y1Q_0009590 [Alligator mississippiensis]|uniref:Uncharacterized protein n=1 Tax=Alligator mississippiensis TaxID=8496 RepID=A0A151NV05_ALLMI|nr:hypothetical protein Y1Q_0009590 [Alligator mississippiensis]